MTDSEVQNPTTAGDILRNYRLEQKVSLIDLASVLRVSVAKLEALENNAWDQLHDAMFVRSLSLAVCRQLQTNATPVLALLPKHDHSKLGEKNEKGLNSPLSRPSLLPQSTFDNLNVFFTPMRWAALGLFVLALCLAIWPEVQHWIVFKDNPEAGGGVCPAPGGEKPPLATALFRDGHLSLVRSAKLAGMGVPDFAQHVSRLGIAIVRLDAKEAARDMDTLDEWLAAS